MPLKRALLPLLALLVALAASCASTVPNTNPIGQTFPTVTGESLDGGTKTFPKDLGGEPTVFIVAYEQDTQFDVDRWLLGILQLETPVQLYELPTIDSAIASVFAENIDSGMRSGIPAEDWGSVVTVYDEAETLVNFLGNEGGQNARVLLVDGEGKVVWFHDRGYSAGKVKALDEAARGLNKASTPAEGETPSAELQ